MLQVRIARFPASSAGVGEQSIAHSTVTSLPVPALDISIGALAGPKGHRNGSSRELLAVGTTTKGCRARNNPINAGARMRWQKKRQALLPPSARMTCG